MTHHPPAVLALSEQERTAFLPEPLWGQLCRELPRLQQIPMPAADASLWRRTLLEKSPEILITCWEALRWPLPEELLPSGTDGLKYVCHLGGTVRTLISRDLLARGLLVTNWGDVPNRVVAEHALLLTLAALRRATFYALTLHQRGSPTWRGSGRDEQLCRSLIGRRVGLHGFGGIARELVPMLRPFAVTLQTYTWDTAAVSRYPDVSVCADVEQLYETSDVVILLASGTPENRHIVTEKLLRMLPSDAVFVNVARGSLVDQDALAKVAGEGRLQVALDVYEPEPLGAASPLRNHANVTLFPHMGGPTMDRRADCGAWALANLKRYLRGEPVTARLTLEKYDAST